MRAQNKQTDARMWWKGGSVGGRLNDVNITSKSNCGCATRMKTECIQSINEQLFIE